MRSLLLKRLLPALLILVALVAAFKLATRPKPVAVLVAVVENGAVETTVANTRAGSVTACRRAKVAPP
ncbi:MAG TPA: efflux RND transporter periplasmic adaptor subunit, partial [Rhodocyclaceae bacterium]|nr:efflux RND transporter periplasmic adaptor subunit [Rhodocyclaceae bacterium]